MLEAVAILPRERFRSAVPPPKNVLGDRRIRWGDRFTVTNKMPSDH
jgi:hypothetical protein